MRYKIIFLILLVTMCIGQEEAPKVAEVEEKPLPEEVEPEPEVVPHEVIQDMIVSYFGALNQRDLDTVQSLTHPYYASDAKSFLDYVSQNNITFKVDSISQIMDQSEFREMMKNLSDTEFFQQVGKRGLSYDVELTVTKAGKSYKAFFVFVYVGELEDGWKVLDPELLQILIETELEVMEAEG